MRIAYLLFAYIYPDYVSRLANKLVTDTENEVFIHVDKKVDIQPFLKLCDNNKSIHFVKKRYTIYWAGFATNEATVSAWKEIVTTGSYDRYVILTSLEYPIQSNRSIQNFFEDNKDVEFIRAANETNSKDIKNLHKYCFYWFMETKNIFTKCWNKMNSILLENGILIRFRKPYIVLNYKKYDIYRGWAHIALTEKAVKYIIYFHDKYPKFNKYFKTVYAPGESYFHTIIYNSPLAHNVYKKYPVPEKERSLENFLNVTYFEYPITVTVFKNKSDYQKLKDSNYLFFRKVTDESTELMDYIDYIHQTEAKDDGV